MSEAEDSGLRREFGLSMEISDSDPKHCSKAHPGGALITHHGMRVVPGPPTTQGLLDLEKVFAE